MVNNLKAYLLILIMCSGMELYSQTIVTGKVLNKKTKEAIPFTTVSMLKGKYGASADVNGSFKLEIGSEKGNDTILFAVVGFKPLKMLLKNLKSPFEIYLQEDVKTLNEVNIDSKRKELEIGSFNIGSTIALHNWGAQFAKRFEMPGSHQYLKEILIRRNLIIIPHSPETIFRINIYDQDPLTKGPGKKICLDTIEVHDLNNALIIVDVTKYNITILNPIFFVAIETLPIPYNERYFLYRPDVYEDGVGVYQAYYEIKYQPNLSIGYSKDNNGWVLSLKPGSKWYKDWYVPAIKIVVN